MRQREKLLDLATAVASAEEVANKLAELLKQLVTVEAVVGERAKSTKVIIRKSVEIPATVYEVGGDGVIEELNIISSFKEYMIVIKSGGSTVLTATWDDLSSVSEYVNWVVAYEDDGKYVLALKNVYFTGGASVYVAPIHRLGDVKKRLDHVLVKTNILR